MRAVQSPPSPFLRGGAMLTAVSKSAMLTRAFGPLGARGARWDEPQPQGPGWSAVPLHRPEPGPSSQVPPSRPASAVRAARARQARPGRSCLGALARRGSTHRMVMYNFIFPHRAERAKCYGTPQKHLRVARRDALCFGFWLGFYFYGW